MAEPTIRGGVRADRGGLAAGRDIVASLINTGDLSLFTGAYQPLAEAYINPWEEFARVDLEHFQGRGWLEGMVDEFLTTSDRGYFVLEAKAGLGKTAFCAHLVKERNWLHHFVGLTGGEVPAVARKNLAAQLALAFNLLGDAAAGLPTEAAARPDYFSNLLREAAERRRPDEKIVLVVDALDEVSTPEVNGIGLPRVLAEGVYVIVSKRPGPPTLDVADPPTPQIIVPLRAEQAENQDDLRACLTEATRRPAISRALRASNTHERPADSAFDFVETLLAKSEGVWVYARFVLAEIEQVRARPGQSHLPLDLNALPVGLWRYYARFFTALKRSNEDRWRELGLPLLSTLAATREELTLTLLAALAGVKRDIRLDDLPRPLLNVKRGSVERGETDRVGLYHASLVDFFDGTGERDRLSDDEQDFVDELARATRQRHAAIADRYLDTWRGLEANLQGLDEPGCRDQDDRYGLRHVASHLVRAGRVQDLHRLLRLEWVDGGPGSRNVWFEARDQTDDVPGYLADIATAVRAAAESSRVRSQGWPNETIGLRLRYALLERSIGDIASAIPPALLAALVDKRRWPGNRALGYARQIRDTYQRADALRQVATHLADSERLSALVEALDTARAIADEHTRAWALRELASQLPQDERGEVLTEALAAARAITNEAQRSWALAALASELPEGERDDVLGEALSAARASVGAIGDRVWHSEALAKLAPQLSAELLSEALEIAGTIPDEPRRSEAVAALAPRLLNAERVRVVTEALASTHTITEDASRCLALIALVPLLSEGRGEEMHSQALAIARAISNGESRSEALAAVASRLQGDERVDVVIEALTAACAITAGASRSRALVWLAPQLPAELLARPLTAARTISDAQSRSEALAALASRLPEDERAHTLTEALAAGRAIRSEELRSETLTKLAPKLPEAARVGVLTEALAAARTINYGLRRSTALNALVPQLPTELLADALAAARVIADESSRSHALAALGAQLPEGKRVRVLTEALAAARASADGAPRSQALAGLAPRLPENERVEVLTQALAAARAESNHWSRRDALGALAPQLPAGLLAEAIAAVRTVPDPEFQSHMLAALAARIPESERVEVLADALAAARANQTAHRYSLALTAIAPQLPQHERVAVLSEALAAARASIYEPERSQALAALVPQLPEGEQVSVLAEALAAARVITNEGHRSQALAALARQLREGGRVEVLGEALAAAAQTPDDFSRSQALATLAPELPAELFVEALAVASTIQDLHWSSQALAALAPSCPSDNQADLFDEVLARQESRASLLEMVEILAPFLVHLGGDAAVEEAAEAICDVARWFP